MTPAREKLLQALTLLKEVFDLKAAQEKDSILYKLSIKETFKSLEVDISITPRKSYKRHDS